MRSRHLVLLLAVVGCAGSRAGSDPDPQAAAFRDLWLLYVEPVQSPVEPQFATLEFRRLLQATGRFALVDDSAAAHAIIRVSLTMPMNSASTVRGRSSQTGTSIDVLPSGTIALSWVRDPETPPWSRAYHGRIINDSFTRSLESPSPGSSEEILVHRALVGITAILRQEAGPIDEMRRVP